MSFQTCKTFVHFQTQIKIFLLKSESFLTLHTQQTKMFPGPETQNKDIGKIVHVTSVVQP